MHPSNAWLRASLRLWTRRLRYRKGRLAAARRVGAQQRIEHWNRLVDKAAYVVHRRQAQLAARRPLRERAYRVAATLVGVMEHGGNNMGETVTKIIRANGGEGPEPWCGDFQAYCYRHAGSKAVTRAWAAVRPALDLSRPPPCGAARQSFCAGVQFSFGKMREVMPMSPEKALAVWCATLGELAFQPKRPIASRWP